MSTPSLVPMFSADSRKVYVTDPDGVPGSIPVENLGEALQNKYQVGIPMAHYADVLKSGAKVGTFVTDPNGQTGIMPHDQVMEALKPENGYKLGPAFQQPGYQAPVKPVSHDFFPGYTPPQPGATREDYERGITPPYDEPNPVGPMKARELMVEAGGKELKDAFLEAATTPRDNPYADMSQEARQRRVEQFRKDYPKTAGAVGGTGQIVGGTLADPATYALAATGGGLPARVIFAGIAAHNANELASQLGAVWDNPDITEEDKANIGTQAVLNALSASTVAAKDVHSVLESLPEAYRTAIQSRVQAAQATKPSLPARAASKVLGGGPDVMAKRPLPQQRGAGQATNAEVAQYASEHGIDLLPGQATQSRPLKAVQAIGERAIVGGAELQTHLEEQRAAFGNLVDDFKGRVSSPDVTDTESAGGNLKAQAQSGLDALKGSAQGDYLNFQKKTGDIPVDLSEVKTKYAERLAQQAEALKNVPAKYAAPVRNVLNKLSSIEAGPAVDPKLLADYQSAVDQYGLTKLQADALREKMGIPAESAPAAVRMSTAQQLRSAYLEIARDYSGTIPKSVQRIAGEAAKDIDAAMAKAADSVGATDQWRQANAKWKQLQTVYNNPESPLYKILKEPEVSKVPTRLLGKGNYGGSPNTVRQLQEAGLDLAPLKREVAQQIADRNFALTNGGRGLAGYSSEFLGTLFTPAELSELQMMGRVGRAINFEMNPSGTSNVHVGERQIHGLMRMGQHAVPAGAGAAAGFVVGGPPGAMVGAALGGAGHAMVPSLAARLTTSKFLKRATMGEAQPPIARLLQGGSPSPGAAGGTSSGSTPPVPSGPAPVTPISQMFKAAAPERRADLNYRAAVDAMTPEQQTEAIFTNKLSRLPNDRAYEVAKKALAQSHPHIGFADVDNFKNYNTMLGEAAVDQQIFPAIGDAMKTAIVKGNGEVHAFHIHGDEFQFLATDPAAVDRFVGDVNSQLKDAIFEIQKPDGTIVRVKGIGFSHGTGPDEFSAGAAEQANKQARKAVQAQAQPSQSGGNPQGQPAPVGQPAGGQGVRAETAEQPSPIAQLFTGSVHQAVRDIVGEVPRPGAKASKAEAMPSGSTIGGATGNETQVKTVNGSLPAKYKLVEADSLIPSHDAQSFAKNPQYPEGVQERAYHTSKEAQARVIQQSQNYEPAYTINTNPDAVNGPPVVTPDGIVLGGNSRAMSTQRLYKAGPTNAYKDALRQQAQQFGIDPQQVDAMKQPVLVREIATPGSVEEARRIGVDLNRNMTGAMGTGEKAVSAGRSVKPATLSMISGMVNDMGEGTTLRDAMRQYGRDMVQMLVKDGVIADRERPQFVDTSTGGLNEEGRTFVERALIGSVVDDPRLMDTVPKYVLGKLEGSLGDLSSIGARGDEYNLLPVLREALTEHAQMARTGMTVDNYLAQGSMFGPERNPAVDALVRSLTEKPKTFREALRQYAQDAKFDVEGQGLLGMMHGKPSAAKAFNDAFGTNLSEDQFHDALLQSLHKEATIGTGNGQETSGSTPNEGLRGNPTPAAQPGAPAGNPKTAKGQPASEQQSPIVGLFQAKRKP